MKLEYENDLESDKYFIDGRPVLQLRMVSIGGKLYTVKTKNVEVKYNDMGHTYSAWSYHYFVKTKVLGTWRWIDLNTVVKKVNITPISFKVQLA